MTRIRPKPPQENRLYLANANRCCVCKRVGIGLNLHHIDGDSANTIDANLAVLCVEDHDRHHRPGRYTKKSNHLDLSAQELLQLKTSWESFILEAQSANPTVLATLSAFGTEELIHSLQLILQWPDERIAYKKSFHLLDGNLDVLTDAIFKELASIGPHVKMAVIDRPLSIEHCPCCGGGYSRTMKPAVVEKLTNPAWKTDSICSIYINPKQASLALNFSLGERELFTGSLHLCQGQRLHYTSEGVDDVVNIATTLSVRTQANNIVDHILADWGPAHVFFGTGDHDNPQLIKSLKLPKCWERRAAK